MMDRAGEDVPPMPMPAEPFYPGGPLGEVCHMPGLRAYFQEGVYLTAEKQAVELGTLVGSTDQTITLQPCTWDGEIIAGAEEVTVCVTPDKARVRFPDDVAGMLVFKRYDEPDEDGVAGVLADLAEDSMLTKIEYPRAEGAK